MAEEQQQERTEQPTQKRRDDARKKGDVPRSRELTMTGVMLSGASALLLLLEPVSGRIQDGMRNALTIDREQIFDKTQMPAALLHSIEQALLNMAPLAIVLLASAMLCATMIGGWSFAASAMAFKAERINPLKGIKKIFSPNSLNELIKATAKFALVGAIAVIWLWWSLEELVLLGNEPIQTAIPHAFRIALVSFLIVSTGLIVISAADVPFQLWNYQKKLRMTRKEIRDELKESEGQPEVKSKIRALQMQVAQRRMLEDLPEADVVITNPTHFAVALKYDDSRMNAPKVVAKGKDLVAARIREIAQEHNVPLFSCPPLARAIYRSIRIGQEISPALYTAVAQVLAYILQLNNAIEAGQDPSLLEPPQPEVDETQF